MYYTIAILLHKISTLPRPLFWFSLVERPHRVSRTVHGGSVSGHPLPAADAIRTF